MKTLKELKMKKFKIKLKLSNGRVRDEQEILVEILKRLKLSKFLEWNTTLTYDEVRLYNSIEAQIGKQYNCNKREIDFKIYV